MTPRPVRFERCRVPRAKSQNVPDSVMAELREMQADSAETGEPAPRITCRAGTYVGIDDRLYGVNGQPLSWFAWPGDE